MHYLVFTYEYWGTRYNDVFTLLVTNLAEIYPVVTKQATESASLEENKIIRAPQYQYVRERYHSNELWYTIPYHLQRNNTRKISMVYASAKKGTLPRAIFFLFGCAKRISYMLIHVERTTTPWLTAGRCTAVSYTHLTLPTKRIV